MRLIFTIFLLSLFSLAQCQLDYTSRNRKAIAQYEIAKQSYRMKDFNMAKESLLKATKEDQYFIEAWLLLGQVYYDAGDTEASIGAYKIALKIDPLFYPNAMFFLAENEFSLGMYEDAREHLSGFLGLGVRRDDLREAALKRLESCEFAIKALANPVPFKPENIGTGINSAYDEYWPSLSADESMMVFTVSLPINKDNPSVRGNRQEDLYYSEFKDGEWQEGKDAGSPPNTMDNEGAQSITGDGKFMVFTACGRSDGFGMCDIYFSFKQGDRWTAPRNMGPEINTGNSEKQPSISSDGRVLYFTSNRPGGLGEFDLWTSHLKEDGSWSIPRNLGDSINTTGYDQSPFIHPDNHTLYFSSTGWPGMGRFDIYKSQKTSDSTWSSPQNLGYPINTHFHEEGLIVNSRGDMAYYSSTRQSERGRDIFAFELYNEARPTRTSYMKGKVFDSETFKPLEAMFELIDLESTDKLVVSTSDPRNGEFLVVIPVNADYALNVSRPGYLFHSENFSFDRVYSHDSPFFLDIALKPIKEGEKIVLRNVFYKVDSFALNPMSMVELNKLAVFMQANPALTIEIGGHTDNTGSQEYNYNLSARRAETVVNYLIDMGISNEKISYKGYGFTQPVSTNDTDEGRAQNRRTELKILSTGK
jgi:outer membrane protein OmpA-like peptidoglycan-associated protein